MKALSFLFLVFASLLGACSADSKPVQVIVKENLSVVGKALLTRPLAGEMLRGYYVDRAGFRQQLSDFSFNSDSNEFSMTVSRALLQERPGLTPVEQVVLMGSSLPDTLFSKQLLGRRSVGYLRFEIFPGSVLEMTDNQSLVFTNYYQGVFAVPLTASLKSSAVIRVQENETAEPSTFYSAGRLLVKVLDTAAQPVADAAVFVVPLDSASPNIGYLNPQFNPLKPKYGPAANRTNVSGMATVLPIPISDLVQPFQFVILKEGFCPLFSEQYDLKSIAKSPEPVLLELETCPPGSLQRNQAAWAAAFDEENVSVSGNVAYTNSEFVAIALTARSSVFRPLVVKTFTNEKLEGVPIREILFPTFRSKISVPLPSYFNSADAKTTTDGKVWILIESVYSESDLRSFGEPPKQVLSAVVSRTPPRVSEKNFTIIGEGKALDLVAASEGARLYLRYSACEPGVQVGIRVTFSNGIVSQLIMKECGTTPAEDIVFPISELTDQRLTSTGKAAVRFYVRDKFGNLNSDDNESLSDSRNIFVDASRPKFSETTLALGGLIGFARKADAVGTDSAPWVFPTTSETIIRINSTNLQSHTLRFASPSACVIEESLDARDSTVAQFQVGAVSAPCGSDLQLEPGAVTFSADAAQNAQFQLIVYDLAGNPSAAQVYEILPCSNSGSVFFGVCWEGM